MTYSKKINGGKDIYDKIDKEVAFKIRPYAIPLFNTHSRTSKLMVLMCTYGYYII